MEKSKLPQKSTKEIEDQIKKISTPFRGLSAAEQKVWAETLAEIQKKREASNAMKWTWGTSYYVRELIPQNVNQTRFTEVCYQEDSPWRREMMSDDNPGAVLAAEEKRTRRRARALELVRRGGLVAVGA